MRYSNLGKIIADINNIETFKICIANSWTGKLIANSIQDFGTAHIPDDGTEIIAVFTSPIVNIASVINVYYSNGHMYGYSNAYSGDIVYDAIVIYR